MKLKIFGVFIILFLGIFLRLYQLGSIPPGLDIDEASFVYDARSILETGKDRFGEAFPLAFRSFGTFLLPVYVYVSVIPVAIFGPTIFGARLVAALASILLIFITYFVISGSKVFSFRSKLTTLLLLSISPWAIFFGRNGHEASLSLMLFAFSVLLFIKSLSKPKWLILVFFIAGIAGLSGLTYYTERYLILIFFPVVLWFFRNKFIKQKKIILLSVVVLLITMIPQLLLLRSGALTRRIMQVNYLNENYFNQNAGSLKMFPFGRIVYIAKEFSTHYLEYFSPRSLFIDPDPQHAKSMPDLSIFYVWMFVPLLFGAKVLLKNLSDPTIKVLTILLLVAPIPAALTIDPFYSMRVLALFWVLTIIMGLGSDYLLNSISSKKIQIALVLGLVIISVVSFYSSYFILFKHERGGEFGYEYRQLVIKLNDYKCKQVLIDSTRAIGAQIWIPFYGQIDPVKFQRQTNSEIKNNYYNNTDLDQVIKLDNLEIKPITWKNEDKILVGDSLAISEDQIKEHNLVQLFQIIGLDGKVKLKAYGNNEINCNLILKDEKNPGQ